MVELTWPPHYEMGFLDSPSEKRHYLNQSNMLNNGHQPIDDDPMPSDEEINDLFKKVLATMDLPPDKSKVLWNYDKERKWEMIRDQKKVQAKQQPRYYLSKLRSYMDPRASRLSKRRRLVDATTSSTQILRDLEISLRTNSIEWVREFLSEKNNGLNILIDYLTFRLLMLQHDLIERKLDKAQHKKSTLQTSTSIAINQDSLTSLENNDLFSLSPEVSIGNQNGSKQNSLLTSLLASHASGHLDTLRIHQQNPSNNHQLQQQQQHSPKSSTLSSSSSSSTNTNSTISSKSNYPSSNEYGSNNEFKQKRSLSSLINTALNNSLLIYNTNTKLSQEMSSRLDEAANQLTGNNLQQLTTANQQLSSTLQLFPKNHSQKLNLGSVSDDIHVCIMCLRSIMNNKKGFNMVMEHPQAINCLALSLNHTSVRTKTLVLELLAVICLVKGGHELIMSAFNNFKLACHERLRFETLIHYFKNPEKFNVDFMIACLQFINIIVHSVEDMNYRTHLQYEFTNLALDEYLDKLKQNESEELQVQIQTYLDNRIDVSALAEEAEVKERALEQVQELLEKLSIANERQTSIQLNYQALEVRLEEALEQKGELAKVSKTYKEQLARMNERLKAEAKDKQFKWEGKCNNNNNNSNNLAEQIRIVGQAADVVAASSGVRTDIDDRSTGSTTIIVNANAKTPTSSSSAPIAAATTTTIYPPPPPPPPPPVMKRLESKPTPTPPPPPPPPPSMLATMMPNNNNISHKKGMAPQPPPMPQMNQPLKTTRMLQNRAKNETTTTNNNNFNNCDMMTLKKTFSTQYKLPTFNWLTLKPNQVRGTIFNEFHDEEKIIKSIDFKEFEEQFKLGQKSEHMRRNDANNKQHPTNQLGSPNGSSQNVETNDTSASPASSLNTNAKRFKQPEKVSFMEHNRLRNMAISLRKLSLPNDLLASYINRLDIDQLSLDSIEILMRMVPTSQEIKAYQEYQAQGKPLDALTEEDKFLCQMSKIERLEQKIKIMFYMKNLEITPQQGSNSISSSYSLSSSNTDSGDLLASTKTKIEFVECAAKSLRNSEGIRILLEYILVFGNYLNSSSRSLASAPAYGFKLQALDMVTEARCTSDKSRNLLHFIVNTILKNLNAKEKAKLAPLVNQIPNGPNANTNGESANNNKGSPAAAAANSARLTNGKRLSPMGAFDTESIKMPYDLEALVTELEQAANVSLETLMIEVKEFERGIELCIKELHARCLAADALDQKPGQAIGGNQNCETGDQLASSSVKQSSSDETICRLQRFIKSRSCDIIEIKDVIQRAQKEFNECAQYFGENPRTIESSALFSLFLRHLKNFRQCQVDNKMAEKRKFDDELRKQIQQQQALRARKKLLPVANQQRSSANANGGGGGGSGGGASGDQEQQQIDMDNLKDSRLLHQDEVSHGTLDILITGLKVEPYRRVDGMRKSIRRLERQATGEENA